MDETYRFSVIIPIYNSAKTLRRCMDSLLSQKRNDLQVLLINDGSGDESGIICREYEEKYSCVCYYEKENGGVSSARNLGLDHAQGRYVLFVDSDDYVAENYFDAIDGALETDLPDLLLFGYYNEANPEKPMSSPDFHAENVAHCAEIVADLMVKNQFNALWLKCYSNRIIQDNHLRFDETIEIAEDLHFIFSYMMHVESVKAISAALYYVDESNAGSLSRKVRPNLGEQLLHACLSMKERLQQANLSKPAQKHYARALSWLYYRSVYSAAKELIKNNASPCVRRKQLRKICRDYSEEEVPAIGLKNKLIAAPIRFNMIYLIDQLARRKLK